MGIDVHPLTENLPHSLGREFPGITLGEKSQISGRDLERTDCRAVARAIVSVAGATPVHEDLVAALANCRFLFCRDTGHKQDRESSKNHYSAKGKADSGHTNPPLSSHDVRLGFLYIFKKRRNW